MTIQRFICNPLQENCYIVSDDTRECVIIDCGAFYPEEHAAIASYIRDNQLTPVHLLATHGHADHNYGNQFIAGQFGLHVEICAPDLQLVRNIARQSADILGIRVPQPETADNDTRLAETEHLLADGDTISFGNHQLHVILTPGHSHGSAIFHCPDQHIAFTGDTLFRMSIGRTDFAEGSWTEMQQSLSRIATLLPKETVILPGHGPQSTMTDELSYNPYFR